MRLVCISDTHGRHDALVVPDGDVLIHAGDLTAHGELDELTDVNAWLGSLPHPHKLVIAGNHDYVCEQLPEVLPQVFTSAIYLQDTAVTIGGRTFYGSPWTPYFAGMAFERWRGRPIRERWLAIPRGVDVLITHGPPFCILDRNTAGLSQGCDDLAGVVALIAPAVHMFGHIHEGYGTLMRGGTTFVNAASLDAAYTAIRPPIVIDLPDVRDRGSVGGRPRGR